MIYLALDTDIWLNLLSRPLKEENRFNEMLYWIKNSHLKILLPENILNEWDRNKENKLQEIKGELNRIYELSPNIIGENSTLSTSFPQDKFEDESRKRIESLDHVFHNLSVLIPIEDEILLKAANRNLKCLAPNHQQESFRDTVNILTIIKFLKENEDIDKCYFSTENYKDFSQGKDSKDELHEQLRDEFEEVKLEYIYRFDKLYGTVLKPNLPSYLDYLREKRRKKKEKELKDQRNNETYLQDKEELSPAFLDDINLLDQILSTETPSKHQVKFVLDLIESDEAYEKYFFKKVENIFWFDFLSEKGYFHPSEVPGPVKTESGGYQIPLWMPIKYLERLSKQLKKKEHHEVIKEIIQIIREVSEKKVDNPHVWHDIINILANLPNEVIPTEIFDHVPTWLRTQFRNSLPSSDLCQKLLPKFLPENPKPDDIQKAENLSKHLFTLKKKDDQTNKSIGFRNSYASLVDLFWLQRVLIEDKLIERVGKHLSNELLFMIADKLKKLILDFPDGLNYSGDIYSVRAQIDEEDLLIRIASQPKENNDSCSVKIDQFEEYNLKELRTKLEKETEKLELEASENSELEDIIESIALRVTSDYSSSWCNSIHKLGEDSLSRDELKMVQTLILRDLLETKARFVKNDFGEVAEAFLAKKYKQPLFRRLLLYAISENWSDHNSIFWRMVKNRDEVKYFSRSHFDKELYFLLKQNIARFDENERDKLNKIIEQGPQVKREDATENYDEYWQLKWYSALKDDTEYEEQYAQLSEKLNLTDEHFENLGEVRVSTVGSVSPYSVEEILEMEIPELVHKITNFSTEDSWKGPSVEGFAHTLEHAVKKEPDRFANELHQFINVYYIYIHYMLRAFEEVWKEKQFFDWEKVLTFCLEYVTSKPFEKDQLRIEDSRRHSTRETVIGKIGNLITKGTQNDDHAFDKKHLPFAKEILLVLVPRLEAKEDFEVINRDYPTYSLNSTAGKLLRGLLDFSLRKARIESGKGDTNGPKWDGELKKLYETILEKEVIDGYILLGMYFGQFNYLDNLWLTEKIKEYYDLTKEKWLAFMGGFTFHHAYKDQEIYELMLPHYQRAIKGNYEFERYGNSGLIRHIASYYIWGTESISKGPLITEFLESASSEQINKLINFFSRVRENIPDNEMNEQEKRILDLWRGIHERFKQAENEGAKNVLSNLSSLTVYLSKIEEDNFGLLKSSALHVNHNFNSPRFLEELNRLKKKGASTTVAKYIGEIFDLMLKNFTPDYDREDIESLVRFMYQNKEDKDVKALSDKICAEYAKRGYEFLRGLYNENK